MYPIKQSTAITVPFFAHDANGDAVTGLIDGGFTKRFSKNGAAFAAMTVTITEMENGWYSIPLSTAHSDTLGLLTILFTHASAKQINLQFRVHARLPDNLAFPTVSGRSVDTLATGEVGLDLGNVAGVLGNANVGWVDASDRIDLGEWLGVAPLALVSQRPQVEVDAYDSAVDFNATQKASINTEADTAATDYGALKPTTAGRTLDILATGEAAADVKLWLTAAVNALAGGRVDSRPSLMGADTVNASALATDAVNEIVDQVWDELLSGHTTAGSFGERLQIIRNGTAQAGAAGTITLDASANATDDFYNNQLVVLVGGTGVSQARFITDYVGSTKVATISPNWITNPDATSVFLILPFGQITSSGPTAAVIADAVWDESRSGHVAGGSFGEGVLAEDLNTAAKASVNTEVDGALDTAIPGSPTANSVNERVAAIDDKLPAGTISDVTTAQVNTEVDNALDTAIPGSPTSDSVNERVKAIDDKLPSGTLSDFDEATDTVDVGKINADATAAAQLAKSAVAIESGAAIAGTLSTTQMSTDLTEATNDHYIGRVVIWTTGVLTNQASDITDYVGVNGVLTFTAVTDAPSATDKFVIL